MRPPAELLDRVAHFRLLAGGPEALSARQGERRSSTKGSGLEFAGNRPYREGDDLRHLDARLYARYRKPYLRERFADRQLRVAMLLDSSLSMDFGTPSKRDIATMLAGLLGCGALSAGDLVEVGMARGQLVDWSDALQGQRSEALLGWLERPAAVGRMPFGAQLRLALPRLRAANLVILISDWWLDDPAQELRGLGELAGAVRALQILAPEEEEPLLLGRGPRRVRDSETGGEQDIVISRTSAGEYAALLERYRQELAAALRRHGGELLTLRSDEAPRALFARLVQGQLLGQIGATRAP